MAAFLRDTPLGQLIRWATKGRILQYPDEQPGFKLPEGYNKTPRSQGSDPSSAVEEAGEWLVVDWYSQDDEENPQNWSAWKKAYLHITINLYTFAVYMSSSIYTPAVPELMRIYGISTTTASLGLGLYVLGYGIGPLVFSPPSEIAAIGRNPVYVTTLLLFVILSVPTALANNIPGFMILRFLQGFFGSPGLANGGGSIGDVTAPLAMPYALYLWAFFPLAGPSVGPMIAGFSVPVKGWRWSMWEIVWISSFSLLNILLLPETSASNILHRRAARLRAFMSNPTYKSQSEITQQHLSAPTIARNSLMIPWKINFLDPSVLFTSLYCGFVYAIFYSFFEVFPLVYVDMYGMNWGEMGLVFMSVLIAVVVAGGPYLAFIHFVVNRAVREGRPLEPEVRLIPAVFASFFVPSGLFLFAWTARPDIHWIVPSIGVMFSSGGVCIIIQSIYVYLSLAYPQYAASLLGANTFCRAAMALAAVLWSSPLYKTLGVAKGTSLLGGLCAGCIIGVFVLWLKGAALRKRSRFAVTD
ncbi:major facilitator superfamily domain-containing protein [Dactylonectria estremocensis]|uniref:Major facilitator superfamily domain-containing protein n=1 Tax=Dactylonectria estremocensis TaxID=1079267 RepID=A0A9P9EKE9_9HYPO|nr:major facilitator superfamily domain-containing protein [Dactylonectria estremocensis]